MKRSPPSSSASTAASIDGAAQPGRRQRKAMATRRSLLEAGLKLFETTPLALITVQDITDGADVAKGVFYLHFKSRDHYLLELWCTVQQSFLARAEAAMAGRRSVRSRAESLIRIYAELSRTSPRDIMFWMRMSSYIVDEIGRPGELLALRRAYIERLAQLVCGGAPNEARDLVGTIDACCWGIIRHHLGMRMKPPHEEALAEKVLPAVRELCSRASKAQAAAP